MLSISFLPRKMTRFMISAVLRRHFRVVFDFHIIVHFIKQYSEAFIFSFRHYFFDISFSSASLRQLFFFELYAITLCRQAISAIVFSLHFITVIFTISFSPHISVFSWLLRYFIFIFAAIIFSTLFSIAMMRPRHFSRLIAQPQRYARRSAVAPCCCGFADAMCAPHADIMPMTDARQTRVIAAAMRRLLRQTTFTMNNRICRFRLLRQRCAACKEGKDY